MSNLSDILFNVLSGALALLVAIDVHECCHAWAAYQLGDYTTRNRVTLNPLAHLDPVGTLFMGINLLYGALFRSSLPLIGWGKPVVYHPHLLRKKGRAGMAIVAAAGPVANVVTAVVFALPIRLGVPFTSASMYLLRLCYTVAMTNVVIAAFNLIPIPPLDGYSVLLWIVNSIRAGWAYRLYVALSRLESYGFQALMLLIMADWILPFSILSIAMRPMIWVAGLIVFGARW